MVSEKRQSEFMRVLEGGELKNKWAGRLGTALAFYGCYPFLVYALINWLSPLGLPHVSFLQAGGLYLLSRILVGKSVFPSSWSKTK